MAEASGIQPPAADGDLRLEVAEDGIGQLIIDQRHSRVNLITAELLEELDRVLVWVERAIAGGSLKALVVASAKPGSFVAGADLEELRRLRDREAAVALTRFGQRVLRRVETLPVPTIAAVDGVCLGGGVALVLACSHRLASAAPHTQIGFPEIRLGLMPGLGATVRLPRLIGLEPALEMILTGRPYTPAQAAELGLVDAVLPSEHFADAVDSFVRERLQRGRTRTRPRRGMARRMMEDTAPGRRVIFRRAARDLVPRAPGAPETARLVVQALADGVGLPLDRAFERDAEAFGELAASESAGSLLHSYRALQRARRSPATPGGQVQQAAVLGAGNGGATVTYLLAAAEIPVRLKDVGRDAVLRGVQRSVSLFSASRGRSRPTARELDHLGELITTTTGFGGFGTVDLSVIAVGGELEPSIMAARESEDHTRAGCLLAFLDPRFRVAAAQQALLRPEQAVGIRLATPIDEYPVAELVVGPGTARDAVTSLRMLLRRLGITPVEVGDDEPTPLQRLLGVYFAEALRLLSEGVQAQAIDGAIRELGYKTGPLERLEEFGADRAERLLARLVERFGDRMRAPSLNRADRHHAAATPRRWDSIVRRSPPEDDEDAKMPDASGIRLRFQLLLINEAARLVDEGLVTGAERIDVLSILGIGFPRARGGLLFEADRIGLSKVLAELEEQRERLGQRFEPAAYLRQRVEAGGNFYGDPLSAGQLGGGVVS